MERYYFIAWWVWLAMDYDDSSVSVLPCKTLPDFLGFFSWWVRLAFGFDDVHRLSRLLLYLNFSYPTHFVIPQKRRVLPLEVHPFFFHQGSSTRECDTPPKNLTWRQNKTADTTRMKQRKKWPTRVFFFPRKFWVKEPRRSETIFAKKRYTLIPLS